MEFVSDVQPVSVEFGMLFFFDEDDEVARRSASFTGVASAADAKLHAFLHTGRDIDADGLFTIHTPFALTDGAFRGDDGAFAVAGGAGGDGLHLAEEGIAYPADLAAAAAGGAGLDAVLVFCAAAAAGGAPYIFFYLDIFGYAFCDLFVVEFDLYAEVTAPDPPGATAAAASASAAKEAAELAEDIIHVHVTAAESAAAVTRQAGMAKAVVLAAFVRIAKDFVGFGGLLELFFGGLITGVAVGMVLHGHLTIGLFDLVGRGSFCYPQYFVIISF